MIGLLFCITAYFTSSVFSRYLPVRWYRPEAVAVWTVAGLLLNGWLTLLGVIIFGPGIGFFIAQGLQLIICYYLLWENNLPEPEYRYLSNRQATVWSIFTWLSSALLIHFFVVHMAQIHADGWYSVGGAWGDLPLHLSLINFFTYQPTFSFDFPLFHGAKLTYPFLIDFISSILYQGGFKMQEALILPGLALAVSFFQIFFFLALRIFKQASTALIAVIIFLFNGSFAGLWYFWRDYQAARLPLWQFLKDLPEEYSNLQEIGLFFTNFVTTLLIPQRSILFGLSVFVICVILFHEAYEREEDVKKQLSILLAAGILAGLMPFAHVHAFFVICLLFTWLTAWQVYKTKKLINPWVMGWMLSLALAAPQLWWQFSSNFHEGFSRFYLGWARQEDESLVTFWLRNLGPAFLFIWITAYLAWRYLKGTFAAHFYAVLLFLFILTNLYLFQPNPYDNLKFIVFFYLGFSLLAAYFLVKLARGPAWRGVVATTLLLSMTATGVLAIAKETKAPYQLYTLDEVNFASRVRDIVPADAVILTSDLHKHPVSTLTGRRVVMGYRGWLWTYGFDVQQTEKDVRAMYAGLPSARQLFDQYGISYVVIGSSEINLWHANQDFYRENFPEVLEWGEWSVYQVR